MWQPLSAERMFWPFWALTMPEHVCLMIW